MKPFKRFSGTSSNFRYGSSWWLGDDFETMSIRQDGRKQIDHTKLAATQRAIGNFVNIVTGKQIPVRFQTAESSYTDGKTVTIGTKIDGTDFDPAVGLALHEGSHIALTNFDVIKDCNKIGSAFHKYVTMKGCDPDLNMTRHELFMIKDLLNWVEDRRIDYHIYTTAPGYRVYYEAMYNKYFNDTIIDKALQSNEKCEETWDDYLFHIINFTNPNRNLNALRALQDIWNVIDLSNIDRLKSTEDALDVSCEVYKLIKSAVNAPVPVSEQDKPESGEGEGDLDGDFEIEFGDGGNGSGEGNGKKLELTPAQMKKLEKAIEKQKDFLNGEAKKSGKLSQKDARVVETLKNSGTESRDVNTGTETSECNVGTTVIKQFNQAVIMTLDQMFDTHGANRVFTEGYDPMKLHQYKYMHEAVTDGIILGRQLGRKLQIRNEEKSLKSTRLNAGKIDRRLIASVGYGNESVFHRIVTDRFKNFFIHISIDASGSMDGDRLRNAVKSAVAVAQAASMTNGIRVQISMRGTAGEYNQERATTIYLYDSAHDKMSKIKSLFPWVKAFGMTPEGIAFESIYKDIKKDAKGDECIFINYSDGMPSRVTGTNGSYDGIEFTRRVVNKMKEINIHILSYFIDASYYGKSEFKRMYGDGSQFIDTSKLTDMAKSLNNKFLEIGDAV